MKTVAIFFRKQFKYFYGKVSCKKLELCITSAVNVQCKAHDVKYLFKTK